MQKAAATAGRTSVARRVAAAAVVALAIGVMPLGAGEYIRRYAVDVPYYDEFNFAIIPYLDDLTHGRLSFTDLATTYWSHPVLFSRSAYLALIWLTEYSNRTLLFASWALLGVVAWLWWVEYRGALRERPRLSRLAWFAPAVWILFSMRQAELFEWSMTLAEVLSLTGISLAYFLLGRAAARPGGFVAALASATAASLSTASGLLVWPVGCAYLAWIDRTSGRPRLSFRPYAWGAAGGAMLVFYFWSLQSPLSSENWASLGQAARFYLAGAGAPLGCGMGSSTAVGVILLGAQLLALISLLRARRPTLAIPFLAFSLLNLGLMGAARGALEKEAALQGRYIMFTTQGVVALHLWLAGWQGSPRPVKVARAALVTLIAVAVGWAGVEAIPRGRGRREIMRIYAYQLRNHKKQPRVLLLKLYPSRFQRAGVVRQAAEVLEDLRFNVFSEPPADPPAPPQGTAVGNIDAVNGRSPAGGPISVDTQAVEIRGWAVDPRSQKPAGQVFLEVGQQRFVGLYGLDRLDVERARGDASMRHSGFYLSFSTALLGPGAHHARLLVVAEDGRTFILRPDPLTLVVSVPPEPR